MLSLVFIILLYTQQKLSSCLTHITELCYFDGSIVLSTPHVKISCFKKRADTEFQFI